MLAMSISLRLVPRYHLPEVEDDYLGRECYVWEKTLQFGLRLQMQQDGYRVVFWPACRLLLRDHLQAQKEEPQRRSCADNLILGSEYCQRKGLELCLGGSAHFVSPFLLCDPAQGLKRILEVNGASLVIVPHVHRSIDAERGNERRYRLAEKERPLFNPKHLLDPIQRTPWTPRTKLAAEVGVESILGVVYAHRLRAN